MKEAVVLDAQKKQDVQYCIPTWLRDEQIKLAIERPIARLQAPSKEEDKKIDPIAVVCFGPSLNDTWEKIRDFKLVISCSGSHRFLVERGIIPTWHVEVDPRPHKVDLIGPPQRETQYLIASACHPKVFDHLLEYNVQLWHVFAAEEESMRTLPPGEWAITGGCSVGLRAMTMARFLGYTNLHIFGMDGSEGPSGKHAAVHPNQPKGHAITEVGGRTFKTTPSMLEAARGTFHELDQMPDVVPVFYGDGLVQAMAKEYVPNPVDKKRAIIGMNKPTLISSEYQSLNRQLHRENLAYGVGGGKHADTVIRLADQLNSKSVLDYGCGKGYLAKAIPFPIWEYDPAVPGKEGSPRPADIVVCTDVLEHVEPEKLGDVLTDLKRCVKVVGYFVINTGPAQKTLADGRNTHLIQKPEDWWRKVLGKFFTVGKVMIAGATLHIVVGPRIKR
jgi:uncharacterized Rossmann fold enzyme